MSGSLVGRLRRVAPHTESREDGDLMLEAAAEIERLREEISKAAQVERERIAEAIHIQRFAARDGKAMIDSYYYGATKAERIACDQSDHPGEAHVRVHRRISGE